MRRAAHPGLAAALALSVAVAAGVAACGKRGDLEAPKGTVYPRAYPAPETMVPPEDPGAETPETEGAE